MLENGSKVTIDELKLLELNLEEARYQILLMEMLTDPSYDVSGTVIEGTVNNSLGEGRYEVTFDIPDGSITSRELGTNALLIIIARAYIKVLGEQERDDIRLVGFKK